MSSSTRARPQRPVARARIALLLAAAALALAAAGCGPRMSGTWADEAGLGRLEFRSDGTVYLTTFGGTVACTYEVDGAHVIVKGPQGTQVLTRSGERLEAGLGLSFVRR